ncbi:MAG: helix-turn-helix transcriptional regulator [Acidobacteria bacterium]|nr:helix-turn-helix transcriptional regulator [Acidobacteriota bacterium]
MNEFIAAFIAGECFLLGFLLFLFPLERNSRANRWLSFFVLILGAAFVVNYLESAGLDDAVRPVVKLVSSLQFLLAPCLYIAILYFVSPTSRFRVRYWLHFLPFAVFAVCELLIFGTEKSIGTKPLFRIGDFEFWVRDLLPFLVAGYLGLAFRTLRRHGENLKIIASATQRTDLRWLRRFLLFLILPLGFWIYDALSLYPVPLLIRLTGPVYAGSLFFLAYNAFRQGVIFPYEPAALAEISEILRPAETPGDGAPVRPRLTDEELAGLSIKLDELMNVEKLYLENELSLPAVAERLGIGVHDASFLINRVAGDNFYNFVNRRRVAEARRLLDSPAANRFNMLGIAFEAGFNSKTAFNTAFKKWTGVTPSEYVRRKKNE